MINVEFNLWTKPDCAGTEYENLNRSWFFFCVQGDNIIQIRSNEKLTSILINLFIYSNRNSGGEPNKICKFNIVNLNKQAKLFSQGMHPVAKIGENGKWERLKESPTYQVIIMFSKMSIFIHFIKYKFSLNITKYCRFWEFS